MAGEQRKQKLQTSDKCAAQSFYFDGGSMSKASFENYLNNPEALEDDIDIVREIVLRKGGTWPPRKGTAERDRLNLLEGLIDMGFERAARSESGYAGRTSGSFSDSGTRFKQT